MATTNFVPGTVVQSAWLNDVDDAVYGNAINVTYAPYFADKTGTDDSTTAIQDALNSGANIVYLPAGTYKITSKITIPNYVTLIGDGYTESGTTSGTIIKKVGNFTGVVVSVAAQFKNAIVKGAPGNGGDGIQILGGRSCTQNVGSFSHGNDGVHIGGYSTDPYGSTNTNLWRAINIITRSNGRYGVCVQHEGSTTAPNVNAGLLIGLDSIGNTSHGLFVKEAVDNHFYNITCQSNGGWGIYVDNYSKGHFFTVPYLEANTSGDMTLEVGADNNYVLGVRGGTTNDGYVNNGANNVIWGRYGSINPAPLHLTPEAFIEADFLEKTTSGLWKIKKDATTRNLSVTLSGTGSSGDLLLTNDGGGSAGLKFGTGAGDGALRGILKSLGTTVVQTVGASTTADYTVTLTGADNSYLFEAIPTHAINAGLTWNIFWNGANVILRFRNHTAGSINVNGTFNFIAKKIV